MELALDRVTVQYDERVALKAVSASFPLGTHALVTGPAASGKTTLVKVLAGLLAPTEGAVLWDGRSVASLTLAERRRQQSQLGMVFQSDALFDSMSVLGNVMYPLIRRRVPEKDARLRAAVVLEQVGLADAADRLPETLSGGMRKRAGIARAIVAEPAVLFADDPLAGLDAETAAQVAALFASVSKKRTLIVCAPEPLPDEMGLPLPRWLILDEGQLVHDGAPIENFSFEHGNAEGA
jgi:phospholipid/cholesterol/gamma-HCH transport system ATP-binding protein